MKYEESNDSSSVPDKRQIPLPPNLFIDIQDHEDDPETELVTLQAGEVLFRQGDAGDCLYVLKAGVLGVRVEHADGSESEIARMAPGAVVGEMALLSGGKRSATIYAVNESGLIGVSNLRVQELLEEESTRSAMRSVVRPRWQRSQLAKVLKDLLGDLEVPLLEALQNQLEWFYYANGDVVMRQGDASDGLYIVISGRLRVVYEGSDGTQQNLGEIGPGEPVGEMGILTGEPRTATVYAIRGTNLVRISPAKFRNLTRAYPNLMTALAATIVRRHQETLSEATPDTPPLLTLTLIPASAKVDAISFAQELGTALANLHETMVLDSGKFEALYGEPGTAQMTVDDPRNAEIAAWMDEMETRAKSVLYVADAEPSPWTRRCIGQADRVLIIADPGSDPMPGQNERLLNQLDVPVRKDLVLWHPPDTERPQKTAVWLDARDVKTHYHVRQNDQEHMDRLARRLSGRSVALVCSGGAARAYSQMGVYRAMKELDIPLDFVSGTSMGSIMAGGIALEYSYKEMEEMAQWVADYSVADYTLPLASLMASEHVTRICQRVFGGYYIEDLWVPFFCVSTNLSMAEPVYHQRGSMWRAIRASMSIPGIYLPVMENEEMLVDGGAMDNFPVARTISICETRRIIGVHVSPFKERKRQYDYDTDLSGWRILLSRINPFSKPLRAPSMMVTLMRALEVNGVYRGKRDEELVEVMIHPNASEFAPTDYDAHREIAQTGYESTLESLQGWYG